jgi:hypothetical protein
MLCCAVQAPYSTSLRSLQHEPSSTGGGGPGGSRSPSSAPTVGRVTRWACMTCTILFLCLLCCGDDSVHAPKVVAVDQIRPAANVPWPRALPSAGV